jgi:hypothetical protein
MSRVPVVSLLVALALALVSAQEKPPLPTPPMPLQHPLSLGCGSLE